MKLTSIVTQYTKLAALCTALYTPIGYALAPSDFQSAVISGNLGLYNATDFKVTTGACTDCSTSPQALWYFQDQTIAVPKQEVTPGTVPFSPTKAAFDDLRLWLNGTPKLPIYPALVWLGAPLVAQHWVLEPTGKVLKNEQGITMPLSLVPKITTNLSYYNARSTQFFAGRALNLRGDIRDDKFVARTIWPEDFRLNGAQTKLQPLTNNETLASLVRAEQGGAQLPLASRILWQRDNRQPLNLANKPVLSFMLNGAQGDDDEAHGGHFAVATGRFGAQGEWNSWLVNNFYNLGSFSEKGIVAATLPMDSYMGDLNSGQAWYRPSYMLVAVLKNDRAPNLYQASIARIFNHFYRHDFNYHHATANCAGINMETLRTMQWNIPLQGPSSLVKAFVGLPFMTLKDKSLDSGKKTFDYLSAEQTNLYPMAAFTAVGDDLLNRVSTGKVNPAGLERLLADDIEAIIYVRIPQFPSSRAFGQAPVASIDEYLARTPEDRAQWKIVPTEPRPFPDNLRDKTAPAEAQQPSHYAVIAYGALLTSLALLGAYWLRRKRQRLN